MTGRTWLAGGMFVIVAAAVAGGFVLAGTPAAARLQRLDERRVSDLRRAQAFVDNYHARHGQMPGAIDAAVENASDAERLRDPETDEPYEYHATGDTAYELCAVFAGPSSSVPSSRDPFSIYTSGRYCFALTVPERRVGGPGAAPLSGGR
jgi:outer membrane murein-binding lipoprotein Lpp